VLNGAAGRAVAVPDIERAARLSRRVGLLALGVTVAARLVASPRRDVSLDFLPLVNEGASYGSRRGGFCFIAGCPVREDSR
jgi:hypothetical protein